MRYFPIQQFGDVKTLHNDGHGVQSFKVVGIPELHILMGKRTRYIVPVSAETYADIDYLDFKAYFLPYIENEISVMILGDKADIFITPPLTGCSIIVTQREGVTKLYHLNARDNEGLITEESMAELMEAIPSEERENIVFALHKTDYAQYKPDRPITFIGLRNENQWTFHYQIQTREDDLCYYSSMTYEDKLDSMEEPKKSEELERTEKPSLATGVEDDEPKKDVSNPRIK